MNIVLFDDPTLWQSLLPLTYTRPVAEMRVGILTIADKWSKHMATEVSYLTEKYLSNKFAFHDAKDQVYINGALCPTAELVDAIKSLALGEGIEKDGNLLAIRTADFDPSGFDASNVHHLKLASYEGAITLIDAPWKIFKCNASELAADFKLITKGRTSADVTDPYTVLYGKENIFIEEGATIKAAIINAENGPVYIGKNTFIHEGAIIKGAFALGEGSHVHMGAKIKGDTTIGPYSKVGGEVSNSVIFGFSNKGHDGFIGNTVIGEWCNLGADTNTSNLKNNYDSVKLWSYSKGGFVNTGEQFCGLIMGDHAKCGINTMFNTGTVVGVSANVFGSGFPRNFIPSFSWGGASGFTTFNGRKADEVAERVMQRRSRSYDTTEQDILHTIFDRSAAYRIWEKKG